MSRAAVFLDRDGTLIEEADYLARLEDLAWFPWAIEAVRLLNRAGFVVCVVTNQGGVGLGHFTESFVGEVHEVMTKTLDASGARVDGWFYCPHHPRALIDALRVACECRKPQPGLVHQAQQEFDLDLRRSFVVGDRATDLELATATGARGVLVRTGHGETELAAHGTLVRAAAHVAPDLMEATAWILRQSRALEAD
jgi:D-glycero-D-manno-heptose 1,7-bisphosphate phosphatase